MVTHSRSSFSLSLSISLSSTTVRSLEFIWHANHFYVLVTFSDWNKFDLTYALSALPKLKPKFITFSLSLSLSLTSSHNYSNVVKKMRQLSIITGLWTCDLGTSKNKKDLKLKEWLKIFFWMPLNTKLAKIMSNLLWYYLECSLVQQKCSTRSFLFFYLMVNYR